MPGETGVTVVTTLVWFYFFPREAAGASSARHSLRPLNFRWLHVGKLARECAARSRRCGWVLSLPLVGSKRAKTSPSYPSSREAVGRVARREWSERGVGWRCFPRAGYLRMAIRYRAPHPALRATLPTKGEGQERAGNDGAQTDCGSFFAVIAHSAMASRVLSLPLVGH
jgi:hypothetical protein